VRELVSRRQQALSQIGAEAGHDLQLGVYSGTMIVADARRLERGRRGTWWTT